MMKRKAHKSFKRSSSKSKVRRNPRKGGKSPKLYFVGGKMQ